MRCGDFLPLRLIRFVPKMFLCNFNPATINNGDCHVGSENPSTTRILHPCMLSLLIPCLSVMSCWLAIAWAKDDTCLTGFVCSSDWQFPHLIGLCPVGTDGGISSRKMCGLGLWIYWIWMGNTFGGFIHSHTHIYIKDVHACAYSFPGNKWNHVCKLSLTVDPRNSQALHSSQVLHL